MAQFALYRMFAVQECPKVSRLRGGPVFDLLKSQEFGSPDLIIREPRDGMAPVGAGLWFVDLSVMLNNLPRLRERFESVVILDVHFPLTEPEHIFGMDNYSDTEANWDVAQYWADPDVERRALAEVQAADVVTVPNEYWAELMMPYNRHVVVLPDVQDVDSAIEFYRIFMTIVNDALYRRLGRWNKILCWFLKPIIKGSIKIKEKQARELMGGKFQEES